jgi:hypothetical protein
VVLEEKGDFVRSPYRPALKIPMRKSEVASVDVAAASALSLYDYQTALKNAGQGGVSAPAAQNEAVLKALSSAYAQGSPGGSALLAPADSLSALAGSSSLSSLVSGIYKASLVTGNAASPISGLSSSLAGIGGLDATTASSLVASAGSGGLDGFSASALSLNATLALTAYADPLGSGPATITALAASGASAVDPSQPASVQQAVRAAQAGTAGSTLNLLA